MRFYHTSLGEHCPGRHDPPSYNSAR